MATWVPLFEEAYFLTEKHFILIRGNSVAVYDKGAIRIDGEGLSFPHPSVEPLVQFNLNSAIDIVSSCTRLGIKIRLVEPFASAEVRDRILDMLQNAQFYKMAQQGRDAD